ncbi:MAG TPA: HslU--HslV peptidase ATPase subunit [Persephonella sp.]|uniref:ATP-dependent protease ATPase subunit HslU n=1 Tax=Persephonella marina (strain DSM 14350 / EX-H1) TaxID=123214 RepID=HSLU_PERMH|nr:MULTISPECIES: ATP-dependent protease ATPase subunit HslU [Persephonella]C0QUM2.1 RecName: Full=ATP-dependent protease ATPase subunit HslU; AltName: Full=Unfoldase HslU [Persephonella marina EX-H1]ACO03654.1 ATP-dependent protease HslVU, ATPase subunit [Persephonella marina EX-H1]HCB69996.1 HslU--HslV peptidase ATPase subunit [Persephonella sp.]
MQLREDLTPKQIVEELDKYIVGQKEAKKAVAIALRNRWRRHKLPEDLRDEVIPKNILMIGPTGVGKTEIARRLASLVGAPFIKVEATKFTEVGYVGRDVESIIRELAEASFKMVKAEKMEKVREKAKEIAEEKILDYLVPMRVKRYGTLETFEEETSPAREKFRQMLRNGELDERTVEIDVEEKGVSVVGGVIAPGLEDIENQLKDLFSSLAPTKRKRRKMTVREAMRVLEQQEAEKLIDMDEVASEAVYRAENFGIVFIDEIDKVAGKSTGSSPDVSREGVQRDLLPIVEGTTVSTKYGPVKTDHILFIAAGAFHLSKPSDLIPELQGRFPIRVELQPLTKDDFVKILTQPKNALIKQYKALMATEGVDIEFTDDAIEAIAEIAEQVNEKTENIGARRLHTILERIMEDYSFEAPDLKGQHIIIDEKVIRSKLGDIIQSEDLTRYIL